MTQYLVFYDKSRSQISATSEEVAIAKAIATGNRPRMIAHEDSPGAGKAVGHRNIDTKERRLVHKQYKELIAQIQTCSVCGESMKTYREQFYHAIFGHRN